MKNTKQFPVLSILSSQFEAICQLPEYNIEITKKFQIGDSTIYEYDADAPNKNTYLDTARENIQGALITCYTAHIQGQGYFFHKMNAK